VRVLYVTNTVHGSGGAERSLAAVAPYLAQAVDFHVVVLHNLPGLQADLLRAGVSLHTIPETGRIGQIHSLRALIRSLNPDLVHTTLIDADIVGRLASCLTLTPVVSSLVSVNYGQGQIQSRGLAIRTNAVRLLDMMTARSVVKFHALTDHVAITMGRRLAVSRSRIDVIPRGRDALILGTNSASRRSAARLRFGVGAEPLVAAAARHERAKGLDVLLSAVPLIRSDFPNVKVIIGGRDGSETSHLNELIDRLDLRQTVSLIGQRDDVADLMCAADVWCVPSRWEGLGSILIEAMALSTPVVASAVPAIVELAGKDPIFRLVEPNDPTALASSIVDVLDSPVRTLEMTAKGWVRFLSMYTAESVAAKMVRFYQHSIDSSRL
jgi:glycosyltransferase involved in cell wall biosynthesis